METKKFDAVAESRKWRESASQRLNAMRPEERINYLQALGKRIRAELRLKRESNKAATVRSA